MKVVTGEEQYMFEVQGYLHDLDPDSVRVELFADGVNGSGPLRVEMARVGPLDGVAGGYAYRAQAPAARPLADYTARLIPNHAGVDVPLETTQILWQR
jgi:starch phosphorylase